MYKEYFYNTKKISFCDRESFNNAILLLTMVKSEYYYIVGFSRPNNIIELAFDFESDLHSVITETMTLNFSESEEYIILRCQFANIISNIDCQNIFEFKGNGKIVSDDGLKYVKMIPKDKLIPLNIENLNRCILEAKEEIIQYLEGVFSNFMEHKKQSNINL